MTANVGQDLALQTQGRDGLAVLVALLRGSRAGQFDVLNSELAEHLGDVDLLLSGEVGTDELLSFTKSTLDDGEVLQT